MKRQFTFHFADEPQFMTKATRQWVANTLRSYRKQPRKYAVHRAAVRADSHVYHVTMVGYDVVAIIQAA